MSPKLAAVLYALLGVAVVIGAYKVWYTNKIIAIILAVLAYFLFYKAYKGLAGPY